MMSLGFDEPEVAMLRSGSMRTLFIAACICVGVSDGWDAAAAESWDSNKDYVEHFHWIMKASSADPAIRQQVEGNLDGLAR